MEQAIETTTMRDIERLTQVVRQFKDEIRQVLGSPPVGASVTSTAVKSTFTVSDHQRLAQAIGVDLSEAASIAALWQVYQWGYQDASREAPKS